jgi:hypothetical protein
MQPRSWDAGGFDSGHLSGYSINAFDEPTLTSVLASDHAYRSAEPWKRR